MTEGLAADLNTVSSVKFSSADGADFTTAFKNITEEGNLNMSATCQKQSFIADTNKFVTGLPIKRNRQLTKYVEGCKC